MDQKAHQLEILYAQQASSWVETMRHPNQGDEQRFVAWLKESPRNVREFLLMLSVDHALGELDARRLHDIQSLVATVNRRVAVLPMRAAANISASGGRRWLAATLAAGVLLAAAGGWAWLASGRAGWQEFETITGEQRTFELADGSVVYLNTHSRVAVRLEAHTRNVRLLRGEALFNVHHDTGRPFRVYTDDAVVQAVGTQFDVYRREDGTVISVLEGRVNVTPADPDTGSATARISEPAAGAGTSADKNRGGRSLGASEEAQVSHAGSMNIREVKNVTDTVAWRERRLIFREQTLAEIVGEFNRYRTEPIRLQGNGVGERIYTGVFDADDADSLVQVLARDPALAVDRSGDAIVVTLRKP
jgi:transmembrane sensor